MTSSSTLRLTAPLLVLLAGLTLACGGEAPPADAPAPAAAEAAQSAAPAAPPAAAPASAPETDEFAPMTSRVDPNAERIIAAGASFALPSTWVSEPPSSSMRLAQARLPGDAGDAQMTLFHFGAGGGGDVESNFLRWLGQVELDEGTAPVRESFDQGAFRVSWVEAEGTLKPSTMGAGPTEPQPGSRLLGAVVEGQGGPWFFKITGPSETVAAHRTAFIDMLKSVELAG